MFDGPADDPQAREKWLDADGRSALLDARDALEPVQPFEQEDVEAALRGVVEARSAKPKDVFQPVRVALAGTTVSPGIFETLVVLGRDESLARIDAGSRHPLTGTGACALNHASSPADTGIVATPILEQKGGHTHHVHHLVARTNPVRLALSRLRVPPSGTTTKATAGA